MSEFPAVDRRQALKLMAGMAAMSTAACGMPPEEIVPYVRMPERLVPGTPLAFATSLLLNGIAQPVLVESHEGRPTKIEGNPEHPASLGATDAFAQAAILGLYDPARSRVVLREGQIGTWNLLLKALADATPRWHANGAGLRILSGAVTSPTLAAAIGTVLAATPGARWHRWQPVNADEARRGAELAFGERLDPLYRLERARTILSLDADLFGPGPDQVRHARGFGAGRRARAGRPDLTRLAAVEPSLTLTGAQADRRLPLRRSAIPAFAQALAATLGAGIAAPELPAEVRAFVDATAAELRGAGARALVAVGASQPAAVHALAHWINGSLGAVGTTVDLIRPVELDPVDHAGSLRDLVADMRAGVVDTLVILDGNPVLDAPADLGFAEALKQVRLAIRHGVYDDETSERCGWHVPGLHELESWSDAAACDGTIGILQPLTTPLYEGVSPYALLGALAGKPDTSAYEAVRDTWRKRSGADDFEGWWRRALHDGFVAETAAAPVTTAPAKLPAGLSAAPAVAGFELALAPDPSVWDGRFAENAWLQELPRPFTKLTWGNVAAFSPEDAAALGIGDGDIVQLGRPGEGAVDIPAVVEPGQAPGAVAVTLGYGRRTGSIGRAIGADLYPLRRGGALWSVPGVTVTRSGAHSPLPTTQEHVRMEGRDLVRFTPLADLAKPASPPAALASFYPEPPKPEADPYAWGMVIDESVCIGCNACVTACQAENNTPVVGPDEIRAGRDMHWLRVDLYRRDEPGAPPVAFQPVPCMHCEKAPCEPVCPVGASVHDSEGLNVQVYNRCIGTRFCQANCPYKVRRFNFFGYADGQEYGDLGDPALAGVRNPDVSVRARGVMEKCTYCVQRVSRARRTAEKQDRSIHDGEVVTACQQACPTQAITFGNIADPGSAVAGLRREPHHYALLAELGTRPRTTYLAQVRDTAAKPEGPT